MRIVRPIPGLSIVGGPYVRCGVRGPGLRNSGLRGVVEDPRPWIRDMALGLMVVGFLLATKGVGKS